jgi:DNA-binding MarR family transcriptional regulator
MPTFTNLSVLQRYILSRLAEWQGGVIVKSLRVGARKTAAESASFSRAVRRLQRRGLVLPYVLRRAKRGERAGLLFLTAQGRALAKGSNREAG